MLNSIPIKSTKKGTLFIPDISGFTHFVSHTEISHSKHIIEELLELILKDAEGLFKVSEIEGDAVLFYRFENQLDVPNILQLATRMFERFHQHLLYYKRDRVCECGACATSDRLSLKFIVHFGAFQEYQIADRVKLFGREVILAHRLLKNSLNSQEYILISDCSIEKCIGEYGFLQNEFEFGSESYAELGKINYWHKSLSPWKNSLPELPPRKHINLPEIQLSDCIPIQADLLTLVTAVTDPEHRLRWMKNLRKMELKEHRINRIKTTHECLIGQGSIEVTLEDLIQNEQEVKLVERAKMDFPAMEFFILYSFQKTENGTEVRMGNSLETTKNGRLISFVFPLISRVLSHQNFQNLKRLKTYVEEREV